MLLLSNLESYVEENRPDGAALIDQPHDVVAEWEQDKRQRAAHVAEWIASHDSLVHLHIYQARSWPDEIMDPRAQSGLTSFQMYMYEHGDKFVPPVVSDWPEAARCKLQNLDLKNYMPVEDLITLVSMLPNLRRLSWTEAQVDPAQLELVATALEGRKVEALYMNLESSRFDHGSYVGFARVESLRELVIVSDDGVWHPDPETLTQHAHRRLPGVAVRLVEASSSSDWLDPLYRIFLPTVEEAWQLDSGVRGLRHLPWLSAEQRKAAHVRASVAEFEREIAMQIENEERVREGRDPFYC
jgi:hypothetical protein